MAKTTPKPPLSARLKALRTLARAPSRHRFVWLRRLSMALTISIVYALPLAHVARFDLWKGHHRLFGKLVEPVFGIESLIVCTLGFYAVTLVLNAVFGRIFCGWGCPVGEASRLGDDVELASKTGKGRLVARAWAYGYALVLGFGVLLWLADPRVFLDGSRGAIARALLGVAVLALVFVLHGRFVRWSFCTKLCPIGIYYSAVQTSHRFGIKFDPTTCKECDVCTQICPVGLHPRDLARPRAEQGGLSIDGFPEQNHCLTCGDCVRACENVFSKTEPGLVSLRLARGGAHRIDSPAREGARGEKREIETR